MAILHTLTRELQKQNGSKIVLLVADGLGGLPLEPGGKTELETANTPNLDALARRGDAGAEHPGAARHHARQRAGAPRAVRLRPAEVPDRPRRARSARHRLRPRARTTSPSAATSARSTPTGNITDRRAGRIASDMRRDARARSSNKIKIPGVEVFVRPVKEYRFVVVFRGDGLGGDVDDTDPQADRRRRRSTPMATDCRLAEDGRRRQRVPAAGPRRS